MKLFAATVILSAVFVHGHGMPFDFNSRVGVVDADVNGKPCLIISNVGLEKGFPINLIVLSERQWVAKAKIKEKLPQSCSRNPMIEGASFYSLEINSTKNVFEITDRLPPVIAVVSSATFAVRNGKAMVDLDKDGLPEFFRDCASNEGIHLTVWSGKPLHGKRRWHFYYYLGYDVVPSCKKKDYM